MLSGLYRGLPLAGILQDRRLPLQQNCGPITRAGRILRFPSSSKPRHCMVDVEFPLAVTCQQTGVTQSARA